MALYQVRRCVCSSSLRRSSLLAGATSDHGSVDTADSRLSASPEASKHRPRHSQSGVNVYKYDDDQVQKGPDDPQHRQDTLLLTLSLLAFSVLLISARDYHLGGKCLYLPPQVNL